MYPIIAALKYHKTTVVLVALEIALTCTIVTNALFLIGDRLAAMRVSTGVADNELVWVDTTGLDVGQGKQADDTDADLAALRAMPGVESVAMSNSLPLGGDYTSVDVFRHPGDQKDYLDNVVEYTGSPGMLKTLGITLSAGRDFLPQEYASYSPNVFGRKQVPPTVAIVTQSMAAQLWPGENPLGRTFWLDSDGKQPVQVVGVAAHLLNPAINKYSGMDRGMILPVTEVLHGMYVLRVRPDRRGAVKLAISRVLQGIDPVRMVKAEIYTDTIADYYHGDRAMIWVLLVVTGCLLALTSLGVVGLSSFWVQQRTRQIGIRRAIGATRRDILRYFQLENLLIVTLGIVLGSLGAIALNLWLMHHYELVRMPLGWLAAGGVVLWLLGQLAVLGPALRASRVPPVVATRSV